MDDVYIVQLLLKENFENLSKKDLNDKTPLDYGADIHGNGCKKLLESFLNTDITLTSADFEFILTESPCTSANCKILHFCEKLISVGFLFNIREDISSFLTRFYHSFRFVRYKAELTEIESYKICNWPKKDLSDLLYMDRSKIVRYVENENVWKFRKLLRNNFRIYFPDTGFMIEWALKKGKIRKQLYIACYEKFEILLHISIPTLCLEKILHYLNETELKRFCE